MKKLDILLLKSYLGPLILTFCIALFVLDMMFLWTYVDDLIGKGISGFLLAELMFYASAVKVPMAFPIAVLVASIMTFGNFGERFELTSIKSSGISLFRFMLPLIYFTIFMSIAAFYFSNNILPIANLKFTSLLSDIRHQKPALSFQEKIFNRDIDNFAIRIDNKSQDQKSVYGVIIYDHSENKGNNHLILADSAQFGYLNNGAVMTFDLYNGHQYKEETVPAETDKPAKLMQTSYKKWQKHFDLSEFQLNREDASSLSSLHRMLNLKQLSNGIDSVNAEIDDERKLMYDNIGRYNILLNDSANVSIDSSLIADFYTELDTMPLSEKENIYKVTLVKLRNVKNILVSKQEVFKYKNKDMIQYLVYMHQKFTLSAACIVLFFIGAPLGAIIKKGGFGWPMLSATLFFVVYIVASIMGEKTAEQMVVTPAQGMWFSTILLLPVGVFLTYKAMNDSPLLSGDFYKRLFSFKWLKKKDA
ncbi:MAG: LptF/LptG family permease [Bacteroidetes bacterium]|nr:LptF/LptG family permease [Bacteroidota bacterium]